MNSEELPRTQPSPVITLPRMKAPGRIWDRAPIQQGPIRVAWAGRVTPAEDDGALHVHPGREGGGAGVRLQPSQRRLDLLNPFPGRRFGAKEGAEGGQRGGQGEKVGGLQGKPSVHKNPPR